MGIKDLMNAAVPLRGESRRRSVVPRKTDDTIGSFVFPLVLRPRNSLTAGNS